MKRGIESLYNEEGSQSLSRDEGRARDQSVSNEEGTGSGRRGVKEQRRRDNEDSQTGESGTRESHKRSTKKNKQSLKVTEGTEELRPGYSISQKNTESHQSGDAMEDRTTTKKSCVEESLKTKTPAVEGERNPATKITLPQAVGRESSL